MSKDDQLAALLVPDNDLEDSERLCTLGKNEKRLLGMLMAQGFSPQVIAEQCGLNHKEIQLALHEPSVRQHILNCIKADSKDAPEILLKTVELDAIFALSEILMRSTDANRLKAAQEILNRTRGKAPQKIENVNLGESPAEAQVKKKAEAIISEKVAFS